MNPHTEPQPPTKTTLCCIVQNKLGALDRLLGALTARGFVPERFVSAVDPQTPGQACLQVLFTFACPDEKTLEKLIKVLHKQVYVLDIQLLMADEAAVEGEAEVAEPLAFPLRLPQLAMAERAKPRG